MVGTFVFVLEISLSFTLERINTSSPGKKTLGIKIVSSTEENPFKRDCTL